MTLDVTISKCHGAIITDRSAVKLRRMFILNFDTYSLSCKGVCWFCVLSLTVFLCSYFLTSKILLLYVRKKKTNNEKTHQSSRSFTNFVSRFSLDNVHAWAAGRGSRHFAPSCVTAAERRVKPLHGDCSVTVKCCMLAGGFIFSGSFLHVALTLRFMNYPARCELLILQKKRTYPNMSEAPPSSLPFLSGAEGKE